MFRIPFHTFIPASLGSDCLIYLEKVWIGNGTAFDLTPPFEGVRISHIGVLDATLLITWTFQSIEDRDSHFKASTDSASADMTDKS